MLLNASLLGSDNNNGISSKSESNRKLHRERQKRRVALHCDTCIYTIPKCPRFRPF